MKRIIGKLLTALRNFLARCSFSAGSTSPIKELFIGCDQLKPSSSVGIADQKVAREIKRPQASADDFNHAIQESEGCENDGLVLVHRNADEIANVLDGNEFVTMHPIDGESSEGGDSPETMGLDFRSMTEPDTDEENRLIQCNVADDAGAARSNEKTGRDSTDADISITGPQRLMPVAEKPSRFLGTKMIRLPRQPAPMEDDSEYSAKVRDISAVDQEYSRWNGAVVQLILLSKPSTSDVYLCVNPRILAWVFSEAGFDDLTAEQAEQGFSVAVANVYRKRVLEYSAHLRVLRRCSDNGLPDCAAFLAASVLAAYHMQSDDEMSGVAYYKRLADLLGCGMSGAHPTGFSPPIFESLWMFLRNWLHENHGLQLAMPGADVGLRRFVALPLAHVPLRALDIEKLPTFFAWAGYEPGSRVRRNRLLDNLKEWQRSRRLLTPTGAEALSDDRSDAVLAQVSAELESWDGSYSESFGRRSALVEVQFDIVQRAPVLAYLPRRPPGFPPVFNDGEHLFEAADEGWYDPVRMQPEDGPLLASGFEWRSQTDTSQFLLRRPEAIVVALSPSSSFSGFLSSRRLLRGIGCSVLCRDEVKGIVEEYISEVAQQRLNAVSHQLLPRGWSIIRDFKAQLFIEAPNGLETLEVDQNIEFVADGGLRIGRRWSWIAGAPPRILVSGLEAGDEVKVSGMQVELSSTGEMVLDQLFANPGEYILEAGRSRQRIEIVNPQPSFQNISNAPEHSSSGETATIALPQGAWTLIGSSPDQVRSSTGGLSRGSLVSCSFRPVWAIQVGAGPGSRVAVFPDPEPPNWDGVRRLKMFPRSVFEQWANIIYAAHIRRPSFFGLNGKAPNEEMVLLWKRYAATAKQIKRLLKN